MATASTYAPQGARVNPSGSPNLDAAHPLLACPEQVFRIELGTAATGDTHTITVPWNCQVLDAWCVYGADGYSSSVDAVTIGNGSSDITAAISFTHASVAGTVARATKIVEANSTIAKGGTIKATVGTVSGSSDDSVLYIRVLVLPTP